MMYGGILMVGVTMAKLVNYTCEECGDDHEEIFFDTEEAPEELSEVCSCGGTYRKNNLKNNAHRWVYMDRNGV